MASQSSRVGDLKARANLETEKIKRQSKSATQGLTPLKTYLLAYNAVSFSLWLAVLSLTVSFLLTPHSAITSNPSSTSFISKLFSYSPATSSKLISSLPKPLVKAVNHLRGSYDYKNLGTLVKWTQTLAVIEVVHSALGWVRSPIGTTASQLFSRIWAVWGIVESVPASQTNPLYTTMILAWSLTEVVRYAFYASSILGKDFYIINWLRYNLFLILYPIGASSEAFLSFSTLPSLSTLPIPQSIKSLSPISTLIGYLPPAARKALIKTSLGRNLLWTLAKAGAKSKIGVKALVGGWEAMDYARFGLFFVWWPALYILYTFMLGQRRKFFSKGRTVGSRKTQ